MRVVEVLRIHRFLLSEFAFDFFQSRLGIRVYALVCILWDVSGVACTSVDVA